MPLQHHWEREAASLSQHLLRGELHLKARAEWSRGPDWEYGWKLLSSEHFTQMMCSHLFCWLVLFIVWTEWYYEINCIWFDKALSYIMCIIFAKGRLFHLCTIERLYLQILPFCCPALCHIPFCHPFLGGTQTLEDRFLWGSRGKCGYIEFFPSLVQTCAFCLQKK